MGLLKHSSLSLAAVSAVFAFALPAAASAGSLYWTNINSATPLSVGTSGLDGSARNNSFVLAPDNPYGLFVTANKIYWTNYTSGTIGRSNLDGSGVNQDFITGGSRPADVSADADHLYWANSSSNSIGRSNLDGSGVNQNFITGTATAATVWVSDDYIYWGNGSFAGNSSIGRSKLDGTGVNQNFITGAGVRAPATVASDANYLYWTNSAGAPTISRAELDGSAVEPDFIIAGADGSLPNGLEISGQYIYWTLFSSNAMGRANLDGSGVDTSFISPLSGGLAARRPLSASARGAAVSAAGGPASVAVSQYELRVSKSGSGTGTVKSEPAGIDCGSACTRSFWEAQRVTLSATPSDGAKFTGWSGDCTGSAASCTVTMSQARSVTANFAQLLPPPSSFLLSVSKGGSGAGAVSSSPAGISCGSDCAQNFASGSKVTLTAVPADTSTFSGWSGACSGSASCSVTMTEARNVTATFSAVPKRSFSLTVVKSGSGLGTVSSTPAGIDCGPDCKQSFADGSSVTLVAKSTSGASFTGWGGDCKGTASCRVAITRARKVEAVFESSNDFKIISTRARHGVIHSKIWFPHAGYVAQRGVRFGLLRHGATVCTDSRNVGEASTLNIDCRLNDTTRRALCWHPIPVSIKTTFTPTGGLTRSRTRYILLHRTCSGILG
ncbi:unannotated protein [freshwater metagenome]|uniref:Unannotated protein n=1 Tax=freshwater metagenome TaxID=449393 RepID=A0A6J5ZU04_9ZZZZ|nr:DUF5050 domain-containing protein [Actinomycetota bacterium]